MVSFVCVCVQSSIGQVRCDDNVLVTAKDKVHGTRIKNSPSNTLQIIYNGSHLNYSLRVSSKIIDHEIDHLRANNLYDDHAMTIMHDDHSTHEAMIVESASFSRFFGSKIPRNPCQ